MNLLLHEAGALLAEAVQVMGTLEAQERKTAMARTGDQTRRWGSRVSRRGYLGLALLLAVAPLRADEPTLSAAEAVLLLQKIEEQRQQLWEAETVNIELHERLLRVLKMNNCV